jgi:hypothetical protein
VHKGLTDHGSAPCGQFEAAFYKLRLAGGVDVYVPISSTFGKSKQIALIESAAFKEGLLRGWRNGDGKKAYESI